MNKQTEIRKVNSSVFDELLNEITPLERAQTQAKMQLAARIEDLIKARGWNKSQFAKQLGKNPSEVSKWLSGTHNFTTDVLAHIAETLQVELATLFSKPALPVIHTQQITIHSTQAQWLAQPAHALDYNYCPTHFAFTNQLSGLVNSQIGMLRK